MSIVKCNGIQINYEEYGSGEPLILIMGLGASGAKWEPHINAYKDYFRCIAVDNRGAGLTDAPLAEAYSTDEMAEDVVALMDELKIESAHIHGISMGGGIAQKIAINHPDRVRSLILTSTFGRASNYFRRSIEILRDSNGVVDSDTFTHLLNCMIWSEEYHENNYNELVASESVVDPAPMPIHAFKAQCNACINHNATCDLHKIQAPTLVASGDVDLLAPLFITNELVEKIPNAQSYVCKGGGHVHHWEFLDEFNKVTLEFLLSNRRS